MTSGNRNSVITLLFLLAATVTACTTESSTTTSNSAAGQEKSEPQLRDASLSNSAQTDIKLKGSSESGQSTDVTSDEDDKTLKTQHGQSVAAQKMNKDLRDLPKLEVPPADQPLVIEPHPRSPDPESNGSVDH